MISAILLSYNRLELLKKTLEAYMSTTRISNELIIVDNGSNIDTTSYIESTGQRSILLKENRGGEALNIALAEVTGTFVLILENDMELLPGWDKELLSKFEIFPSLGQLSILSVEIMSPRGGNPTKVHDADVLIKNDKKVYITKINVGSSSLIRKDLFDRGLRWRTKKSTEGTSYRFPADYLFSQDVMKLGYSVAWNDKDVAINWGHKLEEWMRDPKYYLDNWEAKSKQGKKFLMDALSSKGYHVILKDGKYEITKSS